tara:strand:+ start:175312 stop:179175 length:3864 start_codon:yes stop_codon:yes gene_type:complete
MSNRILTGLYHLCWYAFAFIILNAAVLVTVVRLALPEIGSYNTEIQSWVSKQMEHPVIIDGISAEWRGWTPNLYLENIDLYTQDNNKLITKLDSAHIGIDLIASIRAGEIIPNYLSVSGLDLGISRRHDGSLSISNDNDPDFNTDSTKSSALSGWLLKQKHIILENASVAWRDERSPEKETQFSDVKIELKTNLQRLQIEADISLPEQLGQSLSVKMDVNGNILTPEWSGSVYIEVEKLNPTDLLNNFSIKSIGGIANIKLWTSWEQSRLINFNSELDYATFSLSAGNYKLPVHNAVLKLFGERFQNKDWLLNIKLDELHTTNGLWPASNHQLLIKKDSNDNKQFDGYFSYLNLEDVLPFIIATNFIPDKAKKVFEKKSLKGELLDLNISYQLDAQESSPIQLKTAFNNLEYISTDKNNSISGLKGSLTANREKINIQLNNSSPEIKIDSLYEDRLSFSDLNANLELVNSETVELIIHNLNIASLDLSVNSSGKIRFDKKSPFVDIVAHIDETNIENIPAYLPKKVIPNLHAWFNRALVGGKFLSGDLLFHGHSSDYPFDNAEGRLKALINIENTTLEYNEKWPAIDNFTAEIILNNDDLTIASHSGYIFDAKIDDLKGEIRNLSKGNHQLNIAGSLDGHTSDATHFITQSPLKEKKSLRESINNVVGSFELDLKLDILLNEGNTDVEGLVAFTDATIESNIPGLGLENVNGKVNFTSYEIWADDVQALYQGLPVSLTAPRTGPGNPYSEIYEISGIANKAFILNQLGSFFPSFNNIGKNVSAYFDGESKWSLSLKKSISDNNVNIRNIELSSDLNGFEINLPYPFGKSKEETRPLTLSTRLTNVSINNFNFNFDNLFFTDVIADNSKNLTIKNILIGLGQPHDKSPQTNDISIQGRLEKLNLSEWTDVIALDNISQSQKNVTNQTKSISGQFTIGELQILNNNFNNVNIELNNPDEGWDVSFDGNDIKGHTQLIKIANSQNDKLLIELESLSLHESETGNDSGQSDISKIPELDVSIESFNYNNNQLGKLELRTNNVENGINIRNLSISKPGFNITASGEWMLIDGINRSEFSAKLTSESIETMLATFNYDSANIQGGQTTIEMNANWMDTPMNFSMEKIIGELDMKIDKGQFLDINPSAGRLFGLLSIQTLPRRLALDFTDLFNKGFAFDSISGNFNMDQGHAYTNNLELIGPAANIIVSGRTGIVAEDYDQIATITPKVSNSLPVASALFGPIGVGVGAVIYLTGELFKSIPDKIDQILRYQYSIKGSWDNPDIVKIKKDSKNG